MRYGLVGANGRMGMEIQAAMREAGHTLVYALDMNHEETTGIPEVIIDFSLPLVLEITFQKVKTFNVPVIIGTTGFDIAQLQAIKTMAAKYPVLQSYSFSVGVQLMLECVEFLKKKTEGWDVEISETHHRFKKDKPSGTAIMIRNQLGKDAPIASHRLGNVTGEHTISFGALGEVLSVKHAALSRRAFADGVVLASQFIIAKEPGLYSFRDVLSQQD